MTINAHHIEPPELRSNLVLIAEDNPTLQRLLEFHCNRAGFEVQVLDSCCQIVEAVAEGDYAVIFMDWNLLDEDGLECTRRIRELEQRSGNHVPIIAITGNVMPGDRERCLSAGMDDYLAKPFTRAEFVAVLNRWVSNGNSACA